MRILALILLIVYSLSQTTAMAPRSILPWRPEHKASLPFELTFLDDSLAMRGGGKVVLQAPRSSNTTSNLLLLILGLILIPSVTLPIVRIACTVLVAAACYNLVTGKDLIVMR